MLEAHGNSIVCIHDGTLVKVHIHTLKPGNILTYAQQFGEFKMVKVDNMSEQHEELIMEDNAKKEEAGVKEEGSDAKIEVTTSAPAFDKKEATPAVKKEYGLISVAVGTGVEKLFRDLSVDYIVSGGQTMNPSTEDFVNAIKKINCKNIFIFPNNGNIIMAANQAAEIMKDVCNVHVIPTKTIPEGLVACMVFNPEGSVDDNIESMKENASSVKSGEITYAIKDTTIDGVTVKKDNFMGITHKKIVCCHKHKLNTLMDLLKQMVDEDSQIITVICGQDVTEEEKKTLTKNISDQYGSDLDVEIDDGKQPVYSFFVSVE
jgi:DAK2 domain fusion protein YloV